MTASMVAMTIGVASEIRWVAENYDGCRTSDRYLPARCSVALRDSANLVQAVF